MSEAKQILAVDEQKATLDFLHSVLPLAGGDGVEIRRALSAEEGLLELRRKPYDLLIAGLRLPGMDGLEMARRARRLRPAMPIILATASPLPELREEAAALGVDHFLGKPLDAEEFLAAVQESFVNARPIPPQAAADLSETGQVTLPDEVAEGLEALCAETGAGQVLLVTVAGEVLYSAGRQLHPDIARLVAATAASVSCSLHLSEQLDDHEPQAVQFLEGDGRDLYWANIGQDHFIVILFDAQIRRGRIGTVWVFAQRAVAELKTQLAGLRDEEQATVVDPPSQEAPRAREEVDDPHSYEEPHADEEPHSYEDQSNEVSGYLAKSPGESNEAGAMPAEAEVETGEVDAGNVDAGAAATPAEPGDSPRGLNLDAYWDDALANAAGEDFFNSGISLEEAKAKGLVAEDFDPEDQ
jgi:CheY-like chemotaxis protein